MTAEELKNKIRINLDKFSKEELVSILTEYIFYYKINGQIGGKESENIFYKYLIRKVIL